MKTGFKVLDEIINLKEPQLILLTGSHFIEELSGDIANNVCLKQDCKVLEIIRCRKEYLIQRMIINEANVNYRSWYHEGEYTDEELKKIGLSVKNLINAPKRTPTIIEQDFNLYDYKEIVKLVSDFANHYADKEDVRALVVVDAYPLSELIYSSNRRRRKYLSYLRERNICLKIIKSLRKISHELRCPIIIIDNIDITKKYDTKNHSCNYLTKNDIDFINKINKYVDTFIIANSNNEQRYVFDVDVYDTKAKIGTCRLQYNSRCRRFEDYNGETS